MIEFIFVGLFVAIVIGALFKVAPDYLFPKLGWQTISRFMWAGTLFATLIFVLVFSIGSWQLGKNNKLTFNEYWNGYEVGNYMEVTVCTRDGRCYHEYNCDPYLVAHTSTDAKGNTTTTFTTEYHSCPYTDEEWSFVVQTTLGNYTVGDHWFPTNPDSRRFRWDVPVTADVPSGIPKFYQEVNDRISTGKPGPVTKRMQYDNYILASDESILKTYSDKIEGFKQAGLLPDIYKTVHTFYLAEKTYFVGYDSNDKTEWQNLVNKLNAGLGTELQGDLHLVITQNAAIDADKDAYLTSLKAYWTNPAIYEDDTLSKNSILVVIGTDGNVVTWARATTGMPLGNEYMLSQIQNRLTNEMLTPSNIIGSIEGEIYDKDGKKKARPILNNAGVLTNVLWGIDDPASRFARVSMTGNDEGDVGSGFGYLSDEIRPTELHRTLTMVLMLAIIIAMWIGVYAFNQDTRSYNDRRYYR